MLCSWLTCKYNSAVVKDNAWVCDKVIEGTELGTCKCKGELALTTYQCTEREQQEEEGLYCTGYEIKADFRVCEVE
ncbi:hypothetical protein [Inconstantimicrobium mannanitabidum]|uniref:Uncharacterized protein n=1 Tax=Inconstantimicrobium mannanitabidum TaxID=1604901 RepID=A0ACB5R9B7_9CLOT|nr:hypothetical protein [Clostridium sp. TW13]GKX65631.1 hypothetical protein rsdtw13_08890 [Clostridium sp. TW13]